MSEIEYLLDLIKAHEFNEARLTAELAEAKELAQQYAASCDSANIRAESAERIAFQWQEAAKELQSRLSRYEEGVEVPRR